jgi:uncharacterized OB-fold protein
MGLFEEAGRRFERFKKQAETAAEEEADFECTACGTAVYAERGDCPECGAEAVVAVDGDGSGEESAGPGGSGDDRE